ncbi:MULTISPECIES: hypothetical protein [unclassified Dyella]|uniref:hypothetical protein n=1 Tax=Dyella sp. ASV21 TaxID=2795114 RepID=UPI0018EDDAF0|nr:MULTISPECIES: hypothetical protein [unclassified Dyella]
MLKEERKTGARVAAGRKVGLWMAGAVGVGALVLAIAYPLGLRDYLANRSADAQLTEAMDAIPEGSDPWEAFLTMQRTEQEVLKGTGAKRPKSQAAVTAKEAKWLSTALSEGNEVAIVTVVVDSSPVAIFRPERFRIDHALWTERVLTAADAAARREGGATVADKWMLRAAGQLYAEGKVRQRDVARAVTFFARAWEAGDSLSALDAARLLREQGNKVDAYVWALRCTGPCRPGDFDLAKFQEGLTPLEIARAQHDALPPIVDHRNDAPGG